MSIGQIVVLALVAFNAFYTTYTLLFPKEELKKTPFWKRLFVIIFFVLLPFALFVWGYAFTDNIFVPKLFHFAGTFLFWRNLFLLVVFVSILNILLVKLFPGFIIRMSDEKEKKAAALDGFLPFFVGIFGMSLNAGLGEEYLFRFLFLVGLQPVVLFAGQFVNLTFLAQILPAWLTLGTGSMYTAGVFVCAILLNLVFALLHVSSKKTNNLWHRVAMAWVFGWINFQALIFYGLLGAMFIHFVIDFIVLLPSTKMTVKLLAEQYFKERYNY